MKKIFLLTLSLLFLGCSDDNDDCSECQSIIGKTIIQSEHLEIFITNTFLGCFVVDDFVLKSDGFIDVYRYGPNETTPEFIEDVISYELTNDCILMLDLESKKPEHEPSFPECGPITTHYSPAGSDTDSSWGKITDITCDSITVAGIRLPLE